MMKAFTLIALCTSMAISAYAQENLVPETIRSETVVSGSIVDIGLYALWPAYGDFTTSTGAAFRYGCSPAIGRNSMFIAFGNADAWLGGEYDEYGRRTDYFNMPMSYSVCTAQLHQIDAALKNGKQVNLSVKGVEKNHLSIQFFEAAE